MTRYPAVLRRRIASAAPGRRFTSAGLCRYPGSSTIVPSRSRKTALVIQRADDRVELMRQDRARIEERAPVRDSRDDRWVVRAQRRCHVFICQAYEPGWELRSRERAAADFRFPLHQLRLNAPLRAFE